MNSARFLICFLLVGGQVAATADDSPWRLGWDGALYAYPALTDVRNNSVINPDNSIAHLPESSFTAEGRFNLRAENDTFKFFLRPIILGQWTNDGSGWRDHDSVFLSQGLVRLTLADGWYVSVGREVLNWGLGQFRSPSSPFYFNNGRNDPIRELVGVDVAKLTWTPSRNITLLTGYVQDSGHDAPNPDPWEHTWLFKADVRGYAWAAGLILADNSSRQPFVGLNGQWSPNDAWMLYGEASNSTLLNTLVLPSEPNQSFTIQAESPRRTIVLVGTTWTRENSQSITAEYLYNGFGFTQAEQATYFESAAATADLRAFDQARLLGLALGTGPPLLGRHYLNMVWQNNLLEDNDYWRLMFTRNLTDHSNGLAAYIEHPFNSHLSMFGLGIVNTGGKQGESASLIKRGITLGVRLALP